MTEMETAILRNLVNEVSGALGIARQEIAEAIGWTNVRCIELRLKQAKTALASHAPSEAAAQLTPKRYWCCSADFGKHEPHCHNYKAEIEPNDH